METTIKENSPEGSKLASAGSDGSSSAAPAKKRERSGISLATIFTSLLIVVLGTISVGSTIVAMRMAEERTRAQDDYWGISKALDQSLLAVCTQSELKGSKMEAAREAILEPAVKYYQDYATAHAEDKTALAQLASAKLHLAGLQAKLGREKSLDSLTEGLFVMRQLIESDTSPQVYPSLQGALLKVANQSEWLNMKNGTMSLQLRGTGVLFSLIGTIDVLQSAIKKHPDAAPIRDDLAAVYKAASNVEILAGRSQQALDHLLLSRDTLEQLIREDPANGDYKARLAECLLNAGRLQKTAGDRAKRGNKAEEFTKLSNDALASFERAVELREQLAAASPDDKAREQDLTVVKRELQKLKPAAETEKKSDDAAPPAAEPAP